MGKGKILVNTISWGVGLWLIGWVLGVVFFMIMPASMIGWAITPIATAITLWVLTKKIRKDKFTYYIGLGVIWTIMAIVLDYFFIVKLFHSVNYYKADVYIYYILTFALPIIVGYFKTAKKPSAG